MNKIEKLVKRIDKWKEEERKIPMGELFTVKNVAEYLKISQRSILRYLKAGQLKASKIGHQWRISQKDLEEFLNKNRNLQEKEKVET